MTTELQIQSNRRNAQHSTGPATEAGRAASARNALRHGYCAADIVMPQEDAAQFEALLAGVRGDWLPASQAERELADEIAVALWRRRRLRRAEAELWAERCAGRSGDSGEEPRSLGEAFAQDSDSAGNAIEKLRRWWQGNERHLNRCTDKLALIKRLTRHDPHAPPPELVREQRRHAAREIDLLIDAPVPDEGELPMVVADRAAPPAPREIGKSAEQSQSHKSESAEPVAAAAAAPALPVSQNAAIPPGLPRKERRVLQRKLAKAQRKQERLGRQAA